MDVNRLELAIRNSVNTTLEKKVNNNNNNDDDNALIMMIAIWVKGFPREVARILVRILFRNILKLARATRNSYLLSAPRFVL